jgi:hypothetical protein
VPVQGTARRRACSASCPHSRVDDSAAADTVRPALARQFILEDRTSLRFLCHRGNPPAHRKDLEWLTSQEIEWRCDVGA